MEKVIVINESQTVYTYFFCNLNKVSNDQENQFVSFEVLWCNGIKDMEIPSLSFYLFFSLSQKITN